VALTAPAPNSTRFRRSRRADALFAATDPASAIRSLPADEFFYVVHELGFPDALDIMSHGTADRCKGRLTSPSGTATDLRWAPPTSGWKP